MPPKAFSHSPSSSTGTPRSFPSSIELSPNTETSDTPRKTPLTRIPELSIKTTWLALTTTGIIGLLSVPRLIPTAYSAAATDPTRLTTTPLATCDPKEQCKLCNSHGYHKTKCKYPNSTKGPRCSCKPCARLGRAEANCRIKARD